MKSWSFSKKFFAGFVVIISLLGMACTMEVFNNLNDPESVFPPMGRLRIHNASTDQSIVDIVVEDGVTRTLVESDSSGVEPGKDRPFILPPGIYTVQVQYPAGCVQPPPQEIQIEHKKTVTYKFDTITGQIEQAYSVRYAEHPLSTGHRTMLFRP
jgi:hypothetical protein